MIDLENAKEELQNGGYTCVLCRGEKKVYSAERGVKPLIKLFQSGEDFSRFSAADKVVGKATAFLYVLLGVSAVYARVISESAHSVLLSHGIHTEFSEKTAHIINRAGDGICPFESAVLEIAKPQAAYEAILRKMAEMNITIL